MEKKKNLNKIYMNYIYLLFRLDFSGSCPLSVASLQLQT